MGGKADDAPRPVTRRRWASSAAALLSGLLFALAFPPVEWVVLLPLALVPWLVALGREQSRRRAFVSGVVFGLAYWCASIPWIYYVVTHYGGQGSAMGLVCLVILAGILAEWPAIVAWGTVACAPAGSPRRLGGFVVLWVATEHWRTVAYGGFPWNLTGHALYRHPLWLQTASIWGVFGVGALVMGASALLATAILRRRAQPILLATILVFAVGAWGAWRLAAGPGEAAGLPVVLLQPNLTEEMRATPEGALASYEAVIAQTAGAARSHPALIVVPESALPVYWERSETLRRDLGAIASQGPAILFNDVEEREDGRTYNVARLLAPEGLDGQPYRKVHLVPFGEYVPLPRVFFFVRQISTEIGEFTPAPEPTLIRHGPFRIGMAICYETIYPALARQETADGANLLVTISNDSWYGRAGAQEQHFAGAVLRSVENARFLLRAAITGVSGIVDERGRIVAVSRPNERGELRGTVRLASERTIWVRWGFRMPLVVDGLAGAVLLCALVRLRPQRGLRAES